MVGAFPELEEEVKLFPEILINLMSRGWNLCPNIRMQLVILFLHLFINASRCLRKHLEAPPSDDDDEAVAADPQWQ